VLVVLILPDGLALDCLPQRAVHPLAFLVSPFLDSFRFADKSFRTIVFSGSFVGLTNEGRRYNPPHMLPAASTVAVEINGQLPQAHLRSRVPRRLTKAAPKRHKFGWALARRFRDLPKPLIFRVLRRGLL
jgi:hypothetical protein